MHFLILCILSSTAIFVIFKALDRFSLPSFPIIVINYLAAALIGFLINPLPFHPGQWINADWLFISLIIGIMFILMFFIVAYSSQKAGISVTTVASKMSVIFPMMFSMMIDQGDRLTLVKLTGIISALTGVVLTVYKPRTVSPDMKLIYIPLVLFIGMGLVDSLVKYAQHRFVTDSDTALFSAILFLNAFFAGIVIIAFNPLNYRWFLKPSIWGWGLLLGLVNFGSIFFIVRALNFGSSIGSGIDSSVIFGVNNIGVVSLSVLTGLWIFREKLSPLNWIGISVSAIAILLFSFG